MVAQRPGPNNWQFTLALDWHLSQQGRLPKLHSRARPLCGQLWSMASQPGAGENPPHKPEKTDKLDKLGHRDPGLHRGTPADMRPSIRVVPFLEGPPVLRLTSREREHLASIATLMRVPAGTILCHAGHAAKAVFSVSSGTLASYRERAGGARKIFAFLFAEDLFGLARRGRYTNSVKAITPSVVYRLPAESLAALLTRDGTLQFRFLCKATQMLRDAQRQALMTTVRDPVERVALFLAMLEDVQGDKRKADDPVNIPMTRQDVADYLNLTTGTIRAAVDALEERGLVRRVPPDGISIRDRARFEALVEGDANP